MDYCLRVTGGPGHAKGPLRSRLDRAGSLYRVRSGSALREGRQVVLEQHRRPMLRGRFPNEPLRQAAFGAVAELAPSPGGSTATSAKKAPPSATPQSAGRAARGVARPASQPQTGPCGCSNAAFRSLRRPRRLASSHLVPRSQPIWLWRETRPLKVHGGKELGTVPGPPPVSSRYGASERALATASLRILP